MGRAWHPKALMELGLTEQEAFGLAPEIAEILAVEDPRQAWSRLVEEVLRPELPFELHRALHDELVARWPETKGPLPIWFPDESGIAQTNLGKLMKEKGLSGYEDLHKWSVRNRDVYWQETLGLLKIKFETAPTVISETTENPGQPKWLPGAALNIAESCFGASPEAVAVVWQANPDSPLVTFTCETLERWSRRVALGLRALGFSKGDAVAIDMIMNPASVAIYLGIIRAGCAVVSIADSFSPQEIATRLNIGKAKAIFTMDVIRRGGKTHPMYEKVTKAGAPLAIVYPSEQKIALQLREGDLTWDQFLPEPAPFQSEIHEPTDAANILFSSGTTGDPKAIVWDHTTPIKAAADGYFHHDIRQGDVVAWPTNLGWMMGPWLIFATLVNRGTIALYGDAPNQAGFCKFVQDGRVNLLGVVPSLVKAWRGTHAIDGLDWRAIRAFSSTGECSSAEEMHFLMAKAGYRPVIEYCGGTEIGGGYLTGTVVQPAAPATFTTPALGLDLVILDEAGEPAEHGELFLVPPSIGLSSRLLNRDHETVYYQGVPKGPNGEVLRRHGDQVQRLPGGFFRADGRADDTMNLGGIKVSSAEIERVFKGIEGVEETAAVAIAPLGGGPGELVIFAVLKDPERLKEIQKEMQLAIRRELNPLFKIHEVQTLEALPRTASGKVMRRVLRSKYQAK